MKIALTDEQEQRRLGFERFVRKEIVPNADHWDRVEKLPLDLISHLAAEGYLAPHLPADYGGQALDMISCGLLHQEMGKGCASTRSLLTVTEMVAEAIYRVGSEDQKQHWLNRLVTGKTIAAFCLTEPNVGSDAKSVETVANQVNKGYKLGGRKKWISFGQIADLFLIVARIDDRPSAFLVERDTPGLSVEPISGLLGNRASMLAEIHLNDCLVPLENMLGKPGLGFTLVANSALDLGRYSVAWGCVGLAQACLESSIEYSAQRKQFGKSLGDQQLIREMITNMIANVKAARLLCLHAGFLKESRDPTSIRETLVAKYFASRIANTVASDAVQIHGALGCGPDVPVQRHFRDAKIMEIIEGSTQIQQLTIAKYGYQEYGEP